MPPAFLALHGLFTTPRHRQLRHARRRIGAGNQRRTSKKRWRSPCFASFVFGVRLLSEALVAKRLPAFSYHTRNKGCFADHGGGGWRLGSVPFDSGERVGGAAYGRGPSLRRWPFKMPSTEFTWVRCRRPTIMTGNTIQIMIDLADLVRAAFRRRPRAASPFAPVQGWRPASPAFAAGCAIAALIYAKQGVWCFAIPPLDRGVHDVVGGIRSRGKSADVSRFACRFRFLRYNAARNNDLSGGVSC